MEQDDITCSVICSFASHLQTAVGVISHLSVVERNSPTSVQRRLSLTHEGLEKDIPDGIAPTSVMNK